jgi:hypothetical protein
MKVDLQKKLFEKYPDIFRQKDLSMTQTAMCWGIDCGDGWYGIIDTLCDWLTTMRKFTGVKVEATQVKEKWGTLCFYYGIGDYGNMTFKVVKEMIDFIEVYSGCVCEICGQSGELCRRGGWYKTVCKEHQDEHGYIPMREINDE